MVSMHLSPFAGRSFYTWGLIPYVNPKFHLLRMLARLTEHGSLKGALRGNLEAKRQVFLFRRFSMKHFPQKMAPQRVKTKRMTRYIIILKSRPSRAHFYNLQGPGSNPCRSTLRQASCSAQKFQTRRGPAWYGTVLLH